MTTFIFVRHATNDWVKKGRLPGWMEGIHLNEEGRKQAQATAERLKVIPLNAIYSSHLERAQETAKLLSDGRKLEVTVREDLADLKTGDWTGRSIKSASRTRLWKDIQQRPTHTRMPGGESFSELQGRLVGELERIRARHPKGTVAIVSHADAIKVIVAHYLGLDLNQFQRIMINPASITIIHVDEAGGRLLRLNDTGPLQAPSKHKRKGKPQPRKATK